MSTLTRFFNIAAGIGGNSRAIPVHPMDRKGVPGRSDGVILMGGQWLDLTCGAGLECLPDRGTITWSEEKLGKGAFGVVVKGTYYAADTQELDITQDNGKVSEVEAAIKISRTHNEYGALDKCFLREVRAARLRHKNVIRVFGAANHLERNFVALELAAYGSSSDFWKRGHYRLKEVVALSVVTQVALGLEFLNGENVGHFDMKLDNILVRKLDPLEVMIADFGCSLDLRSKYSDDKEHLDAWKCQRGTRAYMAPEMVQNCEYDESADVWSLGIVAFELFGGLKPKFEEWDVSPQQGLTDAFFLKHGEAYKHVRKDVRVVLLELLGSLETRKNKLFSEVLVSMLNARLKKNKAATRKGVCPAEPKHRCTDRCQVVKMAPVNVGEREKRQSAPFGSAKRATPVVPSSGSHLAVGWGLAPPNGPSICDSRTISGAERTTKVNTGASNNRRAMVVGGELCLLGTPTDPACWTLQKTPVFAPLGANVPAPSIVGSPEESLGLKSGKSTAWSRFKRFFSKKRG